MQPINSTAQQPPSIGAVDLFCGAGGLTYGLAQADITVHLGIDIDPACKFPYESNNNAKFLLANIQETQKEDVAQVYAPNEIRLLAGCAPCQTFSTYNQKASQQDMRWWLLQEFARLVTEVKPELVTMENVPGLTKHPVFQSFVLQLQQDGYFVSHSVVDCTQYGMPQSRKRLVLLASRLGAVRLLTPTEFGQKPSTVKDVIGHLPAIKAGETHTDDDLHQAARLSPLNIERIKHSQPGGTWRDWPQDLVAACHKRTSGKTYPGVYGRMEWDKPSPTVTTQFYGFGNGRFGHPEQDRAISLREGAMLQGFPHHYMFTEPSKKLSTKTVGKLIGNAVPVTLGTVIGKSFTQHIKEITKQEP